jgi:uncharacterized protein (TIGR02466 family)
MLHNLFSIPIWLKKIEITDSLIETCYALSNNASRNFSNVGGWQSDIISPETLPELSAHVDLLVKQVCYEINDEFKFEVDGYWININRKGNYNIPHVHPNSALSGVIYVACNNNTGNIKFNSNSLMEHYPINVFNSKLFTDNIEFQPKVGDVLIFPSWIYHSVLPNNSDHDRISIAFNVKQL